MNTYVTGGTIKRLREDKNLKQSELAEMLGVSDKTVSKWETGRGYPDITLLEPLSCALGVTVMELLSGNTVNNQNRSFNMRRCKFYVCPVCRNVIVGTGDAVVCCHGITLPPLETENAEISHEIQVQTVEDEYYITMPHPMTKEHYISFFAAVSDSGISLKKLYPEGEADARFKIGSADTVYAFCNHHGLFKKELKIMKNDYSAEARERFGKTDAYKQSIEKDKNRSENQKNAIADGLMWIFEKFGALSCKPEDAKAQALVCELKEYISANYYTCTDIILSSLGEMYVNDERFKAQIDKRAKEGTAQFVSDAIKAYIKK